MAVSLVDGAETLDLTPANGFAVAVVDLGFPSVRAVAEERPSANGTLDTTSLHGARVVSLNVKGYGTSLTSIRDQLAAWCRPDRRPYLVVDRDGRPRSRTLGC
jgi:hypothetical protein